MLIAAEPQMGIKMKKWEKNIRRVEPYIPGEQPNLPNMIKLNTNENPYPPSPRITKALNEFNIDTLRLYPDPTGSILIKELANYYELEENQIFVGVGSDDVLAMAFMTFFNSDKPILFPDITYSFYAVWAELFKINYERPQLDANFHMVKEDYYKENGGIIIANPNAPTTIGEGLNFIEDILIHNQESIVIIDEAYIDFGGVSALELINRYDNLLVVQTFSKSRSMAGMRIGYAMGNSYLIKALNEVKYSYNSYTLNQPSLCFGVESIKDKDYFLENLKKIVNTRDRIKKELGELGFTCLNSQCNFLFVTHEGFSAENLFLALRDANIFVRYFNLPRISNYLRITVGTDEEMDIFMEYIKEYISKIKKN